MDREELQSVSEKKRSRNPFTALMKKEWKIVNHSIWYYAFSLTVIIIGIILTCTIGPKIGIDFQSGITINVKYNNSYLTSANETIEKDKITNALKSVEYTENGTKKNFGIDVKKITFEGAGASRNIRVVYRSDYLLKLTDSEKFDKHQTEIKEFVQTAITPEGKDFSIEVQPGGLTSATVSGELLITAICAVIAASVLMLLYVMFRFELASGLAAVLALIHDIGFMFAFMVFCRIDITSTFIAAVVAILGYSINNTLVIFDRVREDMRAQSATSKKLSVAKVVNNSLQRTFNRCLNTALTTLVAMVILALFGVESIKIFAFPIIIGLLAGTYSSFCVAPSLYVQFKNIGTKMAQKRAKNRLNKKKKV